MPRRWTIVILATVTAIVVLGLRSLVRRVDLGLPTETTDVSRYPALLAQWQPTGLVSHFPATIPATARHVRFSAFPGFGQGSSWIQLRLTLPPGEVAAIASSARGAAGQVYSGGGGEFDQLNADPKHNWPTTTFHTADNPKQWEFPKTYTFFVIKAVDRGMGSWDPHDDYGIAISDSTNEVVYWADR